MDTTQRQSIDQNLNKLAETAGFLDIYTQDYSRYFKDIKKITFVWTVKNNVHKIYHPSISLVL